MNRIPFSAITPYPQVNSLIDILYANARSLLSEQLIGFYIDGSLSYGAFDSASDIDFVCVTKHPITPEQFFRLHQSHVEISLLPNEMAIQIEGFYLSAEQVRHHNSPEPLVPNIERGLGEQLKWVKLEQVWNVHRQYLRQGGITVYGPEPSTLIDPISAEDLRRSMSTWTDWLPSLLADPGQVRSRGYQSYIVLTLARILYTQTTGKLTSKPVAVEWMRKRYIGEWDGLLEDAWEGRMNPQAPISPGALEKTMQMVQLVLDSI